MNLLNALRNKGFWQDVGSNAKDFAQGASNSAASNLNVPVDALAWLLRKGGLPINNPVGGSDWMAQQGLTVEPKNKLAGLLGEGFGGVAPAVMAAKAPQIAGGLLSMADNAMAPKTMNSQTGAVVWHGSPHKFDKFDSSKIGTGEGAQAYGHGLYLAESPDVAKSYASALGSDYKYLGKTPKEGSPNDVAIRYLKQNNWDKEAAKSGFKSDGQGAVIRNAIDRLNLDKVQKPGNNYKVDLPDDQIAKMLDWDKPLSQQSNEVQKALTALKDENGYDALQSLKTGYGANFQGATGQDILRALERNTSVTNGRPEVASSFLKKQGIPGIRYLDGGSRGAGAGSSNFVVFPGNENLLQILERNGKGLLAK